MVPKEWKIKTIGDIATVSSGGTPSRKEQSYWNGDIPWVTTAEVKFKTILDSAEKITKEGLSNSSAKLFPINTILMAMYGQGKTRGQVAKLGIEASTNQACAAIILSSDYCVDYYYQFLIYQYENIRDMSNSGSQENLSGSIVKSIPVPVPPYFEQQKIAQILSSWDQAISATEKLLENSQQQKKALMQQLLTGKKRLLDEARSRFNIPWEKHRLGIFLKEEKQRNKDNSISRVLSVTNHSGFVLPENQFSKRIASDEVSNYKIVKKGQYGYNPSRINVGSFARLDQFENGLLSPMYVVFSIKSENLDSDFFLYWMKSNEAKQRINNSTQGSVRDSVGFDAISSFVLKLPEIQEQRKIAKVLSFADQEIETLQKKLDCLKQEKKALMQQLLTGKKRVKVAA
ncbi:restriction endonuclease subunit S [Acinetobacter baumannii]|uniref:restriction endonuclease subunit S n=1 Tax=Acinetobacter baumannii TaxID=470 RepID=UPI0020CEB357|nr:restriction endonuclease subunit S [Acinetobacter baumannii]MCQ1077189.1 restriction endonuclease subunit S [Acinetobacter baumannii]MCT2601921.1 restriction endonuclease subunit S [Acinetobacter baumannii]MDC4731020.1 restriction endonuclease subunit S [Acinetobacter baumannii]MDC4815269.1 restriction endonuclease subunit S [Acinetobacter baumannii]MDI9706313.1 restriction endonuclease subunit S [Acinetobacter baumannii]